MAKFYLVAHDDYYPRGGIDDFSQPYNTFANAYLAYVLAVGNRDNCYIVQSQDDVLSIFDIASFERENKHVRTVTTCYEDAATELYNGLFGNIFRDGVINFNRYYFEFITGTPLSKLRFTRELDKALFTEMVAVIDGLHNGVDADAPLLYNYRTTQKEIAREHQLKLKADERYWNGDDE